MGGRRPAVLALGLVLAASVPVSAQLRHVTGSWSMPLFPRVSEADQVTPRRSPDSPVVPDVRERCAAASAHVRRGEREARLVLAEARPAFGGRPTQARLNRWSERALVPWLVRVHRGIAAATAHYHRAARLGCVPSSMEAARALGALYSHLADELATIPDPDAPALEAALRENPYIEVAPPPGAIFARIALEHYELCFELAVRHAWYGETSRRCAAGMTRLDPVRHPPVEEIIPTPPRAG